MHNEFLWGGMLSYDRNVVAGRELAKPSWYESLPDAITREAYACRDGILLCRESAILNILVETGCQILTELWKQERKTEQPSNRS